MFPIMIWMSTRAYE